VFGGLKYNFGFSAEGRPAFGWEVAMIKQIRPCKL